MKSDPNKKIIRLFLICAIVFVVLFAIVSLASITAFFTAIFSVLSPLFLGAAIAYLLNPLLKLYEFKVFKNLKNKHILRGLSLFMTFFSTLLILVLFCYSFIPALVENGTALISKSDEYLQNATDLINLAISKIASDVVQIEKQNLINAITQFFSASDTFMNTVISYLKDIGFGLFSGIKNVILAIFIAVYILISKERLFAQFRKLSVAFLPGKVRLNVRRYIHLANRTFSDYFIGVLVDACFVMLLSLVIFLLFGIPHALLIAVIVGITNIIPIFGPFIGGIPSFLLIFLANPRKAFLFLILILIIQQIDGNIIAPKILGNSTKLSSLGVIIAITIMGAYFGITGMIIGVPLFSMLVSIGKEIIDNRLKKADLPTDTAEYYTTDSLVDPHEHHERFAARLHRSFVEILQKVRNLLRKFKQNSANPPSEQDPPSADKDDPSSAKETEQTKEAKNNSESEDNPS